MGLSLGSSHLTVRHLRDNIFRYTIKCSSLKSIYKTKNIVSGVISLKGHMFCMTCPMRLMLRLCERQRGVPGGRGPGWALAAGEEAGGKVAHQAGGLR